MYGGAGFPSFHGTALGSSLEVKRLPTASTGQTLSTRFPLESRTMALAYTPSAPYSPFAAASATPKAAPLGAMAWGRVHCHPLTPKAQLSAAARGAGTPSTSEEWGRHGSLRALSHLPRGAPSAMAASIVSAVARRGSLRSMSPADQPQLESVEMLSESSCYTDTGISPAPDSQTHCVFCTLHPPGML